MKLAFDLPTDVGRAELVVGRVVVVNDGRDPVVVSQRFHPHEGDLAFVVDDARQAGAEQVDSEARTVSLDPGMATGSGLLLIASDRGLLLDSPGPHRVAVTMSAPTTGELTSDAVVVTVADGAPSFDADLGLAASGCQLEPEALDRLLDAPPVMRAMIAASAIRAGGWDSMDVGTATAVLRFELQQTSAERLGWLVTALLPPAHVADDPILAIGREIATPGSLAAALIDRLPFDADQRP